MKNRFFAFLLVFFFPVTAQAACIAPVAAEGTMDYFGAPDHVFKFCNGTQWVAMDGGSGSLFAGWPDIILCTGQVFYMRRRQTASTIYESSDESNETYSWVAVMEYNASGNVIRQKVRRQMNSGTATWLDDDGDDFPGCEGKSIATLRAEGRTFNLGIGRGG